MPSNTKLELGNCDHVGTFLGENFKCLSCGKCLSKQEFILKMSRQIVICEEMIKRND